MSQADALTVAAPDLVAGVASLFVAAGISEPSANVVADDLVRADLEGVPSHGVLLVPMYLARLAAGSVSRRDVGDVVADRGGAVVLDAANALGQLTSHQAVGLAIERARAHGLAAVAVRNGFHFGMAGRYARLMADAGAVGFAMSNTRPLMPAPGGAEALVGNNPIAIAVPSAGPYQAEVDMALSASAMGRIRLAEAEGRPIPEGWAVDREGRATTDPAAAIAGMLLPAAGPKGFGLALMIDLLCGGLSGGGVGGAVRPLYGKDEDHYNCSHFFLAVDVAHYRAADAFSALVEDATGRISSSRAAPGSDRVYAPGELAFAAREGAGARCTIAASTAANLVKAGRGLGRDLTSLLETGTRP